MISGKQQDRPFLLKLANIVRISLKFEPNR
jgi:hypothetical protein